MEPISITYTVVAVACMVPAIVVGIGKLFGLL